jgi:uncharacterized membrane protein YccC
MLKPRGITNLSVADLVYAIAKGVASLAAYWAVTSALSGLVGKDDDMVGGMWAAIAAIFVFRSTRAEAVAAGLSRLIGTVVGILLCFIYLLVLPFTPVGLAALVALGALVMVVLGRSEDIITTSITITVVMIVAGLSHEPGWRQPVLRLVDTLAGLTIGLPFRWLASALLSRLPGREAHEPAFHTRR